MVSMLTTPAVFVAVEAGLFPFVTICQSGSIPTATLVRIMRPWVVWGRPGMPMRTELMLIPPAVPAMEERILHKEKEKAKERAKEKARVKAKVKERATCTMDARLIQP